MANGDAPIPDRSRVRLVLILVLISTISIGAQEANFFETPATNVWKGITPLKTSRTDLERVLGKPVRQDGYSFTYKTDSESVIVYFSKGDCKGSTRRPNGWNVSDDTVLEFTVVPNTGLRLKDLQFEGETVFGFGNNGIVLQEKGVAFGLEYALDSRTDRLEWSSVRYIKFLPKQSDNNLRCKGFPQYNPAGSLYLPDHGIGKNVLDGLDLLVAESSVKPEDTVIYAVVYQAQEMSEHEFDELFRSYQTHLYKKRGADPAKIRLLRGGKRKREEFMIEVFYLSRTAPPPVPQPDFPSARRDSRQ